MIKTILIDDEIASIESLEVLLSQVCDDINIVARTTSPIEGLKLISDLKPDLVFLDISMPKMNGFELLDLLKNRDFKVIFLTAHNEFAINAFKANAQDYLLKPVYIPYLIEALNKVRKLISLEKNQIKEINVNDFKSTKVALSNSDGVEFVLKSKIIKIEADGGYSNVFIEGNRKVLLSKNLNEMESIINDNKFFRVNRSHLININHVVKFLNRDKGSILLTDNSEIIVSRRKKDELLELLKTE